MVLETGTGIAERAWGIGTWPPMWRAVPPNSAAICLYGFLRRGVANAFSPATKQRSFLLRGFMMQVNSSPSRSLDAIRQ